VDVQSIQCHSMHVAVAARESRSAQYILNVLLLHPGSSRTIVPSAALTLLGAAHVELEGGIGLL
jgi:hypothetical protein